MTALWADEDLLSRLYPWHVFAEGKKNVAYLDSKGILTGGIGHNLMAKPEPGIAKPGDTIDEATVQRWHRADCASVLHDLDRALPWWRGLSLPRAAVLFDLCFNMGLGVAPSATKKGRGLLSFVNTLAAIRRGDWPTAALGLRQSAWYSDVKSRRAEPLINQLETGRWLL